MTAILPRQARQRLPVYFALIFFAAAMRAAAALLLVPLLTALFSAGLTQALPWLGVLAFVVAIGWLTEWQLIRRAFDVGFATAIATNEKLLDHLLSIPISWLNAKRQGEAQRALAGAVPELFAAFVNLGGQVGISVVLPVLIGFGLLFIAWPLGIVALVAAPFLLGALLLGARFMRRAEADFASASTEAAMRTDEFARTQVVLRAAGRTGTDDTPLGEAIEEQRRTGLRILWFTLPGTLVFSLLLQAALAIMIAVLALMFERGAVNAPQAVALIVAITRYLEPFNMLSDLFPALESARGGAQRVQDILFAPILSKPAADATPGPPSVEFRNATFAPDGRKVLENISFTVPAGTTTAIVGPSGAGKTTLLSLVARFQEVDAGAVHVAGHDVCAYLPATLMAQLAIVFQNVQLFEGSIIDNIRIARPTANDADIHAVADAAGVTEIVSRLGSWNISVGEGGAALSGGERQRISIARALLKNAPILLLDEATSGLDTGNEATIAAALRGFKRRTVLIVAHRIETISHADSIVFVEDGRVIESGSREDLIAQNGRFAAYWRHRRAARTWRLDTSCSGARDIVIKQDGNNFGNAP